MDNKDFELVKESDGFKLWQEYHEYMRNSDCKQLTIDIIVYAARLQSLQDEDGNIKDIDSVYETYVLLLETFKYLEDECLISSSLDDIDFVEDITNEIGNLNYENVHKIGNKIITYYSNKLFRKNK